MRYSEEMYRKGFPLEEDTHEEIESAVDDFTPTDDILNNENDSDNEED